MVGGEHSLDLVLEGLHLGVQVEVGGGKGEKGGGKRSIVIDVFFVLDDSFLLLLLGFDREVLFLDRFLAEQNRVQLTELRLIELRLHFLNRQYSN